MGQGDEALPADPGGQRALCRVAQCELPGARSNPESSSGSHLMTHCPAEAIRDIARRIAASDCFAADLLSWRV